MNRTDLADLAAFAVVAEERSFTRAAARLGVSQSALSHTLRRVEERVGVRLLSRTTRSVALTDAGEKLLGTVRPALDAIDAGLAEVGSLRDKPAGTIRITSADHAARQFIWPALSPLLRAYPDIHVEINVDPGFVDIVQERFDAGVRLGEAIARDMIAVRISPELRMICVASPEYLARHGTPLVPQDLARHRCINLRMTTSGGLYAWEFEKDGRVLNVRVEGQLTFSNTTLSMTAAEEGHGIAMTVDPMMPDSTIATALAAGRLVRILDDWCPPFAGYHLYYPSRRQTSPAFALFVDAVRYRG